jgi:ribonuclease VapC
MLAYLSDEPGADIVGDAIAAGVSISTVNLAETLSTLATRGDDPTQVVLDLTASGLLDGAVTVEPFTNADAVEVGRLRPLTQDAGLSLADRACLALARRLGAGALTADRAWAVLPLDVDVVLIRNAT